MAAYRSANTTLNLSSNSVQVTVPTGTVNGDLLLALIYFNDSTVNITAPAGWTIVDSINTTITAKAILYSRIALSEPANYTWNFDLTARNHGLMTAYSGANTVSPINAHGVQGNDLGSNCIAPSITTVVDNCLLVFLGQMDSSLSTTWTAPAGMTERFDANEVSSSEVADVVLASAGASGTKTATPSDSTDQNAGFLVALKTNLGLPNNYQFAKVGNGMSTGERIR